MGAGRTIVKSACAFDCPDSCGLDVEVEDGRAVRVDGNHAHALTNGFICAKVRRLPELVHGPDRLHRPLRRVGPKGAGRFEPTTWDDALADIARRLTALRDAGRGEAILPFAYGGSNGNLSQDSTEERLFRRLGASRLARTVCAAPSTSAAKGLYGRMPGVALTDYSHARLIALWGVNASVTGIHLVPHVQEAIRQGARLVVVDPRRTPLAARADLHLAVRPGTDVVVALAVIRWLFENDRADRTFLDAHTTGADEMRLRASPWTIERAASVAGIPADDLLSFARMYADSAPAVIRCGWGTERNRNGGSAIAAILALPAVAGKFRVRGGGFTMSNSGAWNLNDEAAIAQPAPATRTINMNRLGHVLHEAKPPVEFLFVYNANPLATLPDQERVRAGLRREDLFTVVFDCVLTDTAKYADIVLPATTFLEHADLRPAYGAYTMQLAPAAIPAVGESRSNFDVFLDLCRRTGVARDGDTQSPEAFTHALLAATADGVRLRGEIDSTGIATPRSGTSPIQFVDVFPNTPDRRVHFVPADLDKEAPGGLYAFRENPDERRFPLSLISPATDRTISSSLGNLIRTVIALEMHPDDAGERHLRDGERVRVWNHLGAVECPLRLNDGLRRGVVFLPKGLWTHNTFSGTTANALVPDAYTDLGQGACFNDARVEVGPANRPETLAPPSPGLPQTN